MFIAIITTEVQGENNEHGAYISVVQAKTRGGAIQAVEQGFRKEEGIPNNVQLNTVVLMSFPSLDKAEDYYNRLMARIEG